MQNQFFNPDECPFEVFGFCEDLLDRRTGKALGSRRIPEPTRPTGSPGRKDYWLTEPVILTKGLRTYTLKASPEKPVLVQSMLLILCGRLKSSRSA